MRNAEFELVVACCAWPRETVNLERIADACNRDLDWMQVRHITVRHRVSPLVYHALKQALPPAMMREPGVVALEQRMKAVMHQSLLQASESARLLQRFTDAGVRPLFLKGTALSMQAFKNVAMRHARDIDMLVGQDEIATAEEILLSEGYQLHEMYAHDGEALTRRMRLHNHFEYWHPQKRTCVELHWRAFIFRQLAENLDPSEVQWVPITAGIKLPTLGDEQLLLYLCAHGSIHSWNRLKWIADVSALLSQRPEGAMTAASRLLEQARERGMEQPVEQALLLTHRLFRRPRILPHIGWKSHVLCAVALRSMIAGDAVSEPLEASVESTLTSLSSLLLKPRLSYVVEVIYHLVYVPQRKLQERPPARLPRAVYPVWRLYHWVSRKLLPRQGTGDARASD